MRLNSFTWAVVLLASLATACRYQEVWSGVEQLEDGTIRISSEEPLCGCAALTNTSKGTVLVRATYRGVARGMARIAPGATVRFAFDWGGHEIEDVYILDGFREDGMRVPLRDVVRLDGPDPWMGCDSLSCPFGELALNVALTQVG